MNKKIVVTGMGTLTPLGFDHETLWQSLLSKKSAVKNVSFDGVDMDQYGSKVGAPVENFSIQNFFEPDKGLKKNGRMTNFALTASKLALEDAGLKFDIIKTSSATYTYQVKDLDMSRCGVLLGIGVHNMDVSEKYHTIHMKHNGPKKVSPFALPYIPTNIAPAIVTEKFGLTGPSYAVSTACASGTHSLIDAYRLLQSGTADLLIAGGCEACMTPYVFGGFDSMYALSRRNDDPDKASRPFDKNRDGFVMGEGAGLLVLETESHALKRGANIYAELLGGAMSSDAFHITKPRPDGSSAIRMINTALESAGIGKDEVDYINCHGTATPLNDPSESFILKQVFGERAYKIPMNSTKSMLGHSIGASGGIEAVVLIKTIQSNLIHPTKNLTEPDLYFEDPSCPQFDKRCDLDYVPDKPREKTVDIALSESFGFGGQNSVVVFKRY